ncbi:DNA (cytosine-5-)-methyltransferase [Clostridium perfringens]|uniref:DNA cytosine methyltransferase n=1 Tax=Clostridium perfringens TaxID=1502 RepID=UPI001F0662BD|nr:DNA (cytosine-5-)-methyltransferase [Clostridium perfringens]MCH1964375.1 DNA (cytosine-5-)-methyltransferase [Clostridium perfringens]
MSKGINVLSLFDGMSCGQIALKRVGINIENYFSSEINKKAISVTQNNYPNTKQLGDVLLIDEEILKALPKIDLLIGGSPCQGFSIAGRKLNFEDKRSVLFFEYLRILNWIKENNNPNVKFLLENVKMKDEIADKIDELLGVKREFIDSRYFTGHIRKRYYWTNIHIKDYEKKEIKLKDVINKDIEFDKDINFFLDRTVYNPSKSFDGIITINPRDNNGKQTWQRGRVYDIEGNCPTICASLFDLNITKDHKKYRKLAISECEKLQGVPIGYTKILKKNDAGELLGNGWTVDVIAHIFKGLKS